MDLSEALAFTCADYCLQVHPHILNMCGNMQLQSVCDVVDTEHEASCYTWITKDTHWFTVGKFKLGNVDETLVYCHENNMLYYSSPLLHLSPAIPLDHAFLVQTTKDHGRVPKCLVTDVLLHHKCPPCKRQHFMHSLSAHFPPAYHVQWGGDLAALESFIGIPGNLPHVVEGIVRYTENPLTLLLVKRLCKRRNEGRYMSEDSQHKQVKSE